MKQNTVIKNIKVINKIINFAMLLWRKNWNPMHRKFKGWFRNKSDKFIFLRYTVSHETWQLVNSLECLLPLFVKLLNTKDIDRNIILESYYSKINFEVKYTWAKDF